MFFLGEIFVDLALPLTEPVSAHCGECTACLDACPTGAITAPYRVDARRCISYLTIEHDGPIPAELRPQMGNRVYGCDDCQLACPWNKFAQPAVLADFDVRPGLAGTSIAALLDWDEAEFLRRTEGSTIRRIGFARWRRNLAVAAGNALRQRDDTALRAALHRAAHGADALVAEHLAWALSAPAAPAALSSSPLSVGALE
jgi:epoxyqueuosine reductase